MPKCPACGDSFDSEQGVVTHTTRWCNNADENDKELVSEMISGESHHMHGVERSQEFKQKMSEMQTGEKNSMHGRTGEENPLYGKSHTEQTKEELSGPRPELSGSNNPNFKHGGYLKRHCESCGSLYKPNHQDQKYCDTKCMAEDFRQSRQVRFCEACCDVYTPHNTSQRYCSIQCSNEAMARDSDMPNFYWAIRKSISEPSWQKIREKFVDDVCYMCGEKTNLHLHHVVPLMAGGLNQPWNLMTLCSSCHKKVEYRTTEFTERHLDVTG